VKIVEARPLFWVLFWVLGDNVMGKGCRPMGLPTLRPTFVSINRCLGEVSKGEGSPSM
jgi:hypothetical protein